MKAPRICLCLGLGILLFGAPALAADVDRAEGQAALVVEEFPIERNGDFPIVPVRIGARALHFLVDTGCPSTLFDISHRKLLGEPVVAFTNHEDPSGHDVYVEIFAAPLMRIGRLEMEGVPILTHDFSGWGPHSGHVIDGFVGMDFLKSLIVQFDFDDGRLRVLSRTPADAGERFDVVSGPDDRPFVNFQVSSCKPKLFLIDTGNNGDLMLKRSLFKDLYSAGSVRFNQRSAMVTFYGVAEMLCGFVDEAALGPYKTRNSAVNTFHDDALGLGYLSRYVMTCDFPNKAIYFKKGLSFDRVDGGNQSGMGVIKRDADYIVDKVKDGSPAFEAGIQAGDVIVRVGNIPAARLSLFQIREQLGQSGRTLMLAVRRDDVERRVKISLREYLKDLRLEDFERSRKADARRPPPRPPGAPPPGLPGKSARRLPGAPSVTP